MWCKNCNLETNEAICPVCGLETSEDLPVEIYWCNDCRIPVIHVSTAADKGICPVCHGKTRYLTADLRPVFPEERLLIALLLDKAPDALMQKSVWATGSRYYIDGMSLSISTKTFETADIDKINDLLEKSADAIDYTFFDENIHRFVLANQHIYYSTYCMLLPYTKQNPLPSKVDIMQGKNIFLSNPSCTLRT